ncbi:hypothetical protein [Sphingobium sp. D43FB]|uniref:hypothetical protein n=1 Tax=Sphingobium sp. D43FB TaxID=2017595 RepID=UPI001596A811|nr:hypothetical protein [Sphingobium sp. D43FB]
MSRSSARALLEAARSFIADIPPLALLNAPRRTGRMLVARIDRYLETAPRQDAPPDVIEETRERWRGEAGIRIDGDAMMRGDGRGIWISAWVLAGPAVQSFDRADVPASIEQPARHGTGSLCPASGRRADDR